MIKFEATIIFLVMILLGSCSQRSAQEEQPRASASAKVAPTKTCLRIEYGATRGTAYTNSKGDNRNLRNLPVVITNDSTIPIRLEIDFSKEYHNPSAFGSEPFKLILFPGMFTQDGVRITGPEEIMADSLQAVFRKYMIDDSDEPYKLDKTLQPGEELRLSLGTEYPNPATYGPFPVAVVSNENKALLKDYPSFAGSELPAIPDNELKILICFTNGSQAHPDACQNFVLGKISYPKN